MWRFLLCCFIFSGVQAYDNIDIYNGLIEEINKEIFILNDDLLENKDNFFIQGQLKALEKILSLINLEKEIYIEYYHLN